MRHSAGHDLRRLKREYRAIERIDHPNIVHRDLKPANVLVRDDGVMKLIDFGILGETSAASPGTMQGTAAYVSPEQIRRERPAPASDLYSLGVRSSPGASSRRPNAAPRSNRSTGCSSAMPRAGRASADSCRCSLRSTA
jgi:serine/threonine protein kinase